MENSNCNQDRQGAYKTVYGYFNAADQSFAGIGNGSIKRRVAGSWSDDWQKAGADDTGSAYQDSKRLMQDR